MAIKDIMTGMFPIQSVTSDLAAGGQLGILPQLASGMSEGQQMGLMGFLAPQFLGSRSDQEQSPEQAFRDQYAPNQFLSQGGVQTGQMSPAQGQDPLSLLDANINRRFGI